MIFRIADTFHKALTRLSAREQKAVKITVFDLQSDPASPGLKFHRIDKSRDPDFWSIRASRDLRIIVHKTADSFLICYVGHHDDAYKWAGRRRIETHPKTGAAQIVEVRELVEEIALPAPSPAGGEDARERPFAGLDGETLAGMGVPAGWVEDIRQADDDAFLEIACHLPQEAAEALLEFAATGIAPEARKPAPDAGPFEHPDAQRRFRVMEGIEELKAALDYPWDQWAVFLHPSQRRIVEQRFSGPAKVAGSAGTGKTVVALHRAAALLKKDPGARVLLTTFSRPLASTLARKLRILTGDLPANVSVLPFQEVARELFMLAFGYEPRPAREEHVRAALESAREELGVSDFSPRFFLSEWNTVVDAWQIHALEDYANVPRTGRQKRLGSKQRARVWPVFARARELLAARGITTWPDIFGAVTEYYGRREDKPFSHIIVDEAQDLGVPELRMFAAIAARQPDALFFAGDIGQRIFQPPFSWKALGADIRGRSHILRVNYRTSHQIRRHADKLLPEEMHDADGNAESRRGAISLFNGPEPRIFRAPDEEGESAFVAEWLRECLRDGLSPEEIGIFVRTSRQLERARKAAELAECPLHELSGQAEENHGAPALGTMHLAKGLEFRAVAVMACDEDILPLQERLERAASETELDHAYETERHLFYVACTRARERLLVAGLAPASEFFADFA